MQCVNLKFIWHKQDLFVIFRCYPLFIIWMPGQSVSFICGAWFWDDDVVIFCQKKGPSGLMSCQGLLCGKITEVCMVWKDLHVMFIALQVVAEVFQCMYDSKEFLVVDFIVAFCRLERLWEVGHWVRLSKSILFQDCSSGKVTCICSEHKRLVTIQ